MSTGYDINKWYWVVAGSITHVYSSAAGDYVSVADATYQAWLNDGGIPTTIVDEASLGEVLASSEITPIPTVIQDVYKGMQADKVPVKLLLKIMINHENRIRALEGSGSISPGQFKNALKNMV